MTLISRLAGWADWLPQVDAHAVAVGRDLGLSMPDSVN